MNEEIIINILTYIYGCLVGIMIMLGIFVLLLRNGKIKFVKEKGKLE